MQEVRDSAALKSVPKSVIARLARPHRRCTANGLQKDMVVRIAGTFSTVRAYFISHGMASLHFPGLPAHEVYCLTLPVIYLILLHGALRRNTVR